MVEEPQTQAPPTAVFSQPAQRVVVVSTKSTGLAIVLALLFGPLGLLYSTITGAIVMFIVNVVIAMVTFGFGLFLTWPICAIWAYVAVNATNKKLLGAA